MKNLVSIFAGHDANISFYHADKDKYYSIDHRDEIREYGRTFEWVNVMENYYLPVVEKLVDASKL